MAKGFYRVPKNQEANLTYGNMSGFVITLVAEFVGFIYLYVPDDACPVPTVNNVPIDAIDVDNALLAALYPIATFNGKNILVPPPNIKGFFDALTLDETLSPQVRASLPTLFPLMSAYVSSPEMIEKFLTALFTSGINPYLNQEAIQNILFKAQQYHLPITMPGGIIPMNLPLFFEGFAKATLDNIFTVEQWQKMAILRDISDVQYRDSKIVEIAMNATPEQLVKLLELAAAANFILPLGG